MPLAVMSRTAEARRATARAAPHTCHFVLHLIGVIRSNGAMSATIDRATRMCGAGVSLTM